eukprot:NODE_81_length_22758_cov_0.877797.p3 type:complete len:456 gc:universal NODE_81_length_22758_cov_0.877797:9679-11046(+)
MEEVDSVPKLDYQKMADELRDGLYNEFEMQQMDFLQVLKDAKDKCNANLFRFLINYVALVDFKPIESHLEQFKEIALNLSFENMLSLLLYNIYIKKDDVEWIQCHKEFVLENGNEYTDELLLYCALSKDDVNDNLYVRIMNLLEHPENREPYLKLLIHCSEVNPTNFLFNCLLEWVIDGNIAIDQSLHCIFVNISMIEISFESFEKLTDYISSNKPKQSNKDSKIEFDMNWNDATLLVLANNIITDKIIAERVYSLCQKHISVFYKTSLNIASIIDKSLSLEKKRFDMISIGDLNYIQSFYKLVIKLSTFSTMNYLLDDLLVPESVDYVIQIYLKMRESENTNDPQMSTEVQSELIKSTKWVDLVGDVLQYYRCIAYIPIDILELYKTKDIWIDKFQLEDEWIKSFEKMVFEGARLVNNETAKRLLKGSRFSVLKDLGGNVDPLDIKLFISSLVE